MGFTPDGAFGVAAALAAATIPATEESMVVVDDDAVDEPGTGLTVATGILMPGAPNGPTVTPDGGTSENFLQ